MLIRIVCKTGMLNTTYEDVVAIVNLPNLQKCSISRDISIGSDKRKIDLLRDIMISLAIEEQHYFKFKYKAYRLKRDYSFTRTDYSTADL